MLELIKTFNFILIKRVILYSFIFLIIFLFLTFVIVHIMTNPSNNRNWQLDQKILASTQIKDNLVTVYNIRNFEYISESDYISNYYDETFDLNKIKKVWYIVEPFSGIPGSAHTFLSFEFDDDQFLSVSVEVRKEKGESFHPIKGLFNQYELIYVVASEKDAIKLRSNFRQDLVYVYPTQASIEQVKELFIDIMNRVNKLNEEPEFYNTITNSCTSNIVKHVNNIVPKYVPFFSLRVLLPANSDKLAYELGLIDSKLPFTEIRQKFLINERALKYADDPDFSLKIRER